MSVVVPARDAAATLPATLAALAAQDLGDPVEVLVVDDGSTDGTRAIAAAHPVVTRVLDGGGNGPGAARNRGIAVAGAPVVAFTDADCVPEPGWLVAGLRALEAADLVQGRVIPDGDAGPWDRTVRVGGLTWLFETANLLVRAELLQRLGGFEPWLSPKRSKELGEDVWLGWRAQRAGARIAFAPEAVVRHAVFPGTPRSFVTEKLRLRFFPAMAKRIPELRTRFFYRRVFLNRRSAAFDLALVGIALRIPVLVLPYAREVRRTGARDPRDVAVRVAADATGFAALLAGSVRARSLLL